MLRKIIGVINNIIINATEMINEDIVFLFNRRINIFNTAMLNFQFELSFGLLIESYVYCFKSRENLGKIKIAEM